MMKKFVFFLSFLFVSNAHCPLCTVGAAAAAGGALMFGVHTSVVGLFLGAFAVSTGWVVSKMIKKMYIPLQKPALIFSSFVATILPLSPLLGGYNIPFPIFLFGEYGSLFNTTYVLDLFLVGSVLGGILVSITPFISAKITELRGNMFPFQGLLLTFFLLGLSGILLQLYL